MDTLTTLLNNLVAIDPTNPDLVPEAAGEGDIARFIANWLEQAGLDVSIVEPEAGRPNGVALAKGSGGGRSLLRHGHMDTGGAGGMAQPHQPRVDGGRLYGRGAYDMKGGLAACMVAIANARKESLRG